MGWLEECEDDGEEAGPGHTMGQHILKVISSKEGVLSMTLFLLLLLSIFGIGASRAYLKFIKAF